MNRKPTSIEATEAEYFKTMDEMRDILNRQKAEGYRPLDRATETQFRRLKAKVRMLQARRPTPTQILFTRLREITAQIESTPSKDHPALTSELARVLDLMQDELERIGAIHPSEE